MTIDDLCRAIAGEAKITVQGIEIPYRLTPLEQASYSSAMDRGWCLLRSRERHNLFNAFYAYCSIMARPAVTVRHKTKYARVAVDMFPANELTHVAIDLIYDVYDRAEAKSFFAGEVNSYSDCVPAEHAAAVADELVRIASDTRNWKYQDDRR